jgi:hypothetical protein
MKKTRQFNLVKLMPLPLPPTSLTDLDDGNRAPPGAALVLALLGSLFIWSAVIVYLFWR